MKFRHAAARALVGWYLMVPPTKRREPNRSVYSVAKVGRPKGIRRTTACPGSKADLMTNTTHGAENAPFYDANVRRKGDTK